MYWSWKQHWFLSLSREKRALELSLWGQFFHTKAGETFLHEPHCNKRRPFSELRQLQHRWFVQSQEKRVYMNLNAIDTDPFRNSDKLKIGWFFHTKTEERVLREFYYNSFIPIEEKRFYMNFTTIDTDPFQSSGNFNTNALGLRVLTHSLPRDHKQQQNVKALFSWYTFEQSWHK